PGHAGAGRWDRWKAGGAEVLRRFVGGAAACPTPTLRKRGRGLRKPSRLRGGSLKNGASRAWDADIPPVTARGRRAPTPSPMAKARTAASPRPLHPGRLFPSDPAQRAIARRLYEQVDALPIVSPHGHTDPAWWATDAPFANATELLLVPDHYLFRMLYSQGVPLDALGIPRRDGTCAGSGPRKAWRVFGRHFHLFRGNI